MAKNDIQDKTLSIEVNSHTVIGSQFAQIVGISVNDDGVTLDFIYINPQITPKKGETVGRVTLPRKSAEQLSALITSTIKKHEDKKRA